MHIIPPLQLPIRGAAVPASTTHPIQAGAAAFNDAGGKSGAGHPPAPGGAAPPPRSISGSDHPYPAAVDAATGRSHFQVMNFLDGSTAVRSTIAGPWKAVRGPKGRFAVRGSGAATFARNQNRHRGRAR